MQEIDKQNLDTIVLWMQLSERILFITGAGISVDSGVSTYRGKNGIYNQHLSQEGYTIEEIHSKDVFQERPDLTWQSFFGIYPAVLNSRPNKGHELIAEFEKHLLKERGRDVWIATQNIDGYHKDAGSKNLLELHGTLQKIRCSTCDFETKIDISSIMSHLETFQKDLRSYPRCPACNGALRPSVVLFNESLPHEVMNQYAEELKKGFDLIFVIGTTAQFSYIIEPLKYFSKNNSLVVEINPEIQALEEIARIYLPINSTAALDAMMRLFYEKETNCS